MNPFSAIRLPSILVATTLLSLSTGASASEHPGSGNAVTRWNAITTEIMIADNRGVLDSRIYAMTQAAVHDAINAIQPRFESYTPGLLSSPGASVAAAVASAAANVLLALVPSQVHVINQQLSVALAAIPNGPAKSAGIALGRQAAQLILDRRADDGADTPGPPLPSNPANPNDPYVSTNLPGDYRFDTTPNFGFALYPSWGLVTPFVIDVAAHAQPGPDSLRGFAYAADFAYTKAIGGAVSSLRTAEQEQIAHFWFEASPSRVEPHRQQRYPRAPARRMAGRPGARAAELCDGRRVHRRMGSEVPPPILAPRDRHSRGGQRREPADPLGPGLGGVSLIAVPTLFHAAPARLPVDAYGARRRGGRGAHRILRRQVRLQSDEHDTPRRESALPGVLRRRDRKRAVARFRGHSLRSRGERRIPPGTGHRTSRGNTVETDRPVTARPPRSTWSAGSS